MHISEPTLASGGAVSITYAQTLKARAWKVGMPSSHTQSAEYNLQVAQPSVSPGQGSYASAQTVTMSTTTAGATIRYTTDGSVPTESLSY